MRNPLLHTMFFNSIRAHASAALNAQNEARGKMERRQLARKTVSGGSLIPMLIDWRYVRAIWIGSSLVDKPPTLCRAKGNF